MRAVLAAPPATRGGLADLGRTPRRAGGSLQSFLRRFAAAIRPPSSSVPSGKCSQACRSEPAGSPRSTRKRCGGCLRSAASCSRRGRSRSWSRRWTVGSARCGHRSRIHGRPAGRFSSCSTPRGERASRSHSLPWSGGRRGAARGRVAKESAAARLGSNAAAAVRGIDSANAPASGRATRGSPRRSRSSLGRERSRRPIANAIGGRRRTVPVGTLDQAILPAPPGLPVGAGTARIRSNPFATWARRPSIPTFHSTRGLP
jgi:hypothetical protein